MSYDVDCYVLAESFLSDESRLNNEKHKKALAQEIQNTIESYIGYARDRIDAQEPDLAALTNPAHATQGKDDD